MPIQLSTLVYVVRGDRVLLMRRERSPNRGRLSPPGGKLEPGETPIAGAARELREETGLVALAMNLRGRTRHHGPSEGDGWLQHLVLVRDFRGTPRSGHPEGVCSWIPYERVLEGRDMPAADAIYTAWVFEGAARPFDARFEHRADGSVESFTRW